MGVFFALLFLSVIKICLSLKWYRFLSTCFYFIFLEKLFFYNYRIIYFMEIVFFFALSNGFCFSIESFDSARANNLLVCQLSTMMFLHFKPDNYIPMLMHHGLAVASHQMFKM